jgi:hypothetical protein
MTDTALDIVQRSYVLHARVRAMRGDDVLADDVPVAAGTLEIDRTVGVPERLVFTVPRLVDGFSWDPSSSPDHPLAPFGQTVTADLGVEMPGGDIEWVQRGEFLIWETGITADTVMVEAVGLLALIEEARFTTPYQASGTFKSTVRSLVEPALTVAFSGDLVDRNVPTASLTVDDDRLGALRETLTAWPAHAYVDAVGVLQVVPSTDPSTPVMALSDASGGTVVSWAGSASRDGGATLVVARGQDSNGAQVQGIAYDNDPASPLRYGGPFNPLPVPAFFESPLLTTQAQCQAAANTRLATIRRSSSRMLSAATVPHPGLEAGDLVTITGVEDVTLPLRADAGAMMLDLRVTA